MANIQMTFMEDLKDSTDLLKDLKALRKRAYKDGYLYFSEYLDKNKILHLRKIIMDTCVKHNWIKKDTNPEEGIANPDLEVVESQDPRWLLFYEDVLRIREFHALALDTKIIEVFKKLFGKNVLPHSRNICRIVFPGTAWHTTPPHQDNHPIGGSIETWTAWIPCGDCPKNLGGLAVALGSHKFGKKNTHEATGPGGHQVDVSKNQIWLSNNYVCGDLLIFHSLTIHQGRDNISNGLLRASLDYRYQPIDKPIREDSLLPHGNRISWEDIYRDWEKKDPIKFYWHKLNANIINK